MPNFRRPLNINNIFYVVRLIKPFQIRMFFWERAVYGSDNPVLFKAVRNQASCILRFGMNITNRQRPGLVVPLILLYSAPTWNNGLLEYMKNTRFWLLPRRAETLFSHVFGWVFKNINVFSLFISLDDVF